MAIEVRPAVDHDRRPLALLFAAVAEERDGIASEPPIDVEKWAANWQLDGTLVALAEEEVVGELGVEASWFGVGEIGMMVAADWRGRGVGTALVAAAIDWARARGLHKLTLSVFPHNHAAIRSSAAAARSFQSADVLRRFPSVEVPATRSGSGRTSAHCSSCSVRARFTRSWPSGCRWPRLVARTSCWRARRRRESSCSCHRPTRLAGGARPSSCAGRRAQCG